MTEERAPYVGSILRLRSLTIKQVKVKKEQVTKISVKWEQQQQDESYEGHSYWSYREPTSGFWGALAGLLPHFQSILRLPSDYQNLAVEKITVTYDEDDHMIAKVTCQKHIQEGVCTLETPAIAEAGDYEYLMPDAYRAALDHAAAFAISYAHNKVSVI